MNAPDKAILKLATERQREAINPQASIWVAASAGTGKTTVLTNRVLYLMLNGTPPERILCLTFTKAAAAEMANRIAERLEQWTAFDDKQLIVDIEKLTGGRPSSELRHKARQLFARVLDVPGGLKIQTIHSFCQALLKRFPLETGVAPHFDVLDERGASELLHETREEILRRARGDGDGALQEALAIVTGHVGEDEFNDLMAVLTGERARLQDLMDRLGSIDAVVSAIRKHLAIGVDDTVDQLLRAACQDSAFDAKRLRQAADALTRGSAPEAERGAKIAAWLSAAVDRRIAGFDGYLDVFLKDGGEARAKLANRATLAALPAIMEILIVESARLVQLRARLNAVTIATATAALLRLADGLLAAYRRHKEARALLDYEDLVLGARNLLSRPGIAPWVLYKLDGGLDHILIDEAQDTNPEQWEVVAALADEFFAGEGARGEVRTVFAVGDAKQSIYGFQRADPTAFKRMKLYFGDRITNARGQFYPVDLTISFRSANAILDAVNAVFKNEEAQEGLLLDGSWPDHQAARIGQAGLVELWPPARPRKEVDLAPWTPPVERRAGDLPRTRLARLIATRIQAMIAAGDRLLSKDRPVLPGDFLVLVRRRNEFVEELVRELKQRNIAVAGVDRMVLTEQLAVMDLMALGHFLLLPEDDLTLATVLKSPLIGFDEDDLYDLAEPRDNRRLWHELKRRAVDKPIFSHACNVLSDLLAQADYRPPYELYGDLLGRGGARLALLSRLGPEAADALDEFLNLALAYQRNHAPSLQGFLQWLGTSDVQIKRDLDQESRGQVRIMTVHGAKGLQSPIVILPDTMQTPRPTARLLWSAADKDLRLPLWSPRRSHDEARATRAREAIRLADAGEQHRLLYVALTRAEDRLYVCGWHGKNRPPDDCWHRLVSKGLVDIAQPFPFDCSAELGAEGWQDTGYRCVAEQTAKSEPERAPARGTRPIPTPLPPWYRAAPAPEPVRPRPLTPSRPTKEEPTVRSPIGADGQRFRRGVIIHRLLQILPDVAHEKRATACRQFLKRAIHELSAGEQEEIAHETLRVLDHPEFAALFGPGSRAEVPIAGEIAAPGGGYIVSGQIDRLLVADDAVSIIDYKSNRPPPTSESDVAEIYLRQMAAYRVLLARIYPDRPVNCALLWTDGPRLMPLSAHLLDGYLP